MQINTNSKYDVIVAGGGIAGVLAAVAAAKNGAKVMLIESQSCLGGTRTASGVDTFYGYFTPGENPRKIVGGLPDEVASRLRAQGAMFERPNTYGSGLGYTYDVEILKIVLEEMLIESGADLLLHTFMGDAEVNDGLVNSITIANKGGFSKLEAGLFIDTTGDADIVAKAGADFIPLAEGECLQSLTTIFFMGNVDLDQALKVKHADMARLMQEADSSGEYNLPRKEGSFHRTPLPGVIQANMTRITNIDATNPFELTKAEIEGRKQVQQYVAFLKNKIPGFDKAFLISTNQYIGVRETRKILGHYVLTEEDVVSGKKFSDSIACCGAPVEEHHSGGNTRWVYVQGDGVYNIPYRALVPINLKNVIVAGRCLSATHGAQASARNTAQVMAMGEAAGTAAAICLKDKCSFKDIDMNKLQNLLKAQNAII